MGNLKSPSLSIWDRTAFFLLISQARYREDNFTGHLAKNVQKALLIDNI